MKGNKSFERFAHLMFLLALGLSISACGPGLPIDSPSNQDNGPALGATQLAVESPQSAGTPQEDSPVPTVQDGFTYEEMRRIIPPAPRDVHWTTRNGTIRLDWSPPPLVNVPHQYSDVIIHYNIYRRTKDQASAYLLATSEDLFYVDDSIVSGTKYYYSVSAVYEGPLEGERTDEVSATVP